MALGIPSHSTPVNEDSELLLNYHFHWIQQMRRKEGKHQRQQRHQQDTADIMMIDDSDDAHHGFSSAPIGPVLILDE